MNKRKNITALMIALSISLCSVVSASGPLTGAKAFYSGGGFKNLSVTQNLRYMVAPSAKSLFSEEIDWAISEYSSIDDVNFGFEKVSWISDRPDLMIFNSDDNPHLGDLPGIMLPCNYNSNGACKDTSYNSRWDASVVLLSYDNMKDQDFSPTNRKKTVIHEFGHVYALEHQPANTDSIMVGGKGTLTSPTDLDVSNLQWKY
ncbi:MULTISPECIES: hypothetical protein [Brevibacillus]|jgi:hypothetical protein|uniref:Peptidase M10 metallopeptidase domain-containing protein n=1 Tax=Brevibacillus parabrevis TaxID=54914 RepID=A0A4Y3PN09_BREPA|nr:MULTISPECIES: hypothetical protein [Brevibacillus]NRQ56920.1 hypothetical protein [Brevibacillus sp. HD1.4A]RNB96404.1 hypothetical protein EDM60_03490 [Brevibacillus parabrevis]GEB35932.1 hypothetical protein BPA01_55120 [Brevibacillus parabrevis]